MKTLKYLLKKEFKQIFRNKALLPMLFIMPVMQLLIMPLAANYEIKNIKISIIDNDHSVLSQKLINKITSSGYFQLTSLNNTFGEALKNIEDDSSDLILEIPNNFESDLSRIGQKKVFLAANAINGVKAGLGSSYLGSILLNFSQEIPINSINKTSYSIPIKIIETQNTNWFNRVLNYRQFMVPGILVILVTMIGAYMCSLNIVKEKEIGTIEQINVSPIKKHIYLLGKLIPFWIIGTIVFSIGLFIIAFGVYGIRPQGSILLLYGFLALYLITVLGIGMLISTYAQTQQQAMSIAFFFMMIFILMSGLFTPIESMPSWAKTIASLNPVTYFIQVMRNVILKGSTFSDITKHIYVMSFYALLFNTWAILNYKKQE
ncbi:MAG: ABC transporter permease [Flavobacteriales bacterium]|nr:ABC transporter permease [Flavobacteriales bacterium]